MLHAVHKCSIIVRQLQASQLRFVHLLRAERAREQRLLLLHWFIVNSLLLGIVVVGVFSESVCYLLQNFKRSRLVWWTEWIHSGTWRRSWVAVDRKKIG